MTSNAFRAWTPGVQFLQAVPNGIEQRGAAAGVFEYDPAQNVTKVPREPEETWGRVENGIEKRLVGGIGVTQQRPQRFLGGAEDGSHAAAEVEDDSYRDGRILLAERAYRLSHSVFGQRK